LELAAHQRENSKNFSKAGLFTENPAKYKNKNKA
jgi:hypothetical protein